MIDRRRQAEQHLQQPVDARRPEQIVSAHHVRDALERIVDDDRKMVARRHVPARQHHVAPGPRRGRHRSGLAVRARAGLRPIERESALERPLHVEPQCELLAGGDAVFALGARKTFRGSGIERGAVRIARPRFFGLALGDQAGNLGAALEARVDQILCFEPRERLPIERKMFGLAPHLCVPAHAEPSEILEDRCLEFRPAARLVDVLDAQQEASAARPRHVVIDQRRVRMPEMQISVRARRKAEDRLNHGESRRSRSNPSPLVGEGGAHRALRGASRVRVLYNACT